MKKKTVIIVVVCVVLMLAIAAAAIFAGFLIGQNRREDGKEDSFFTQMAEKLRGAPDETQNQEETVQSGEPKPTETPKPTEAPKPTKSKEPYQGIFMKGNVFISIPLSTSWEPGVEPCGIIYHVSRPVKGVGGVIEMEDYSVVGDIYESGKDYVVRDGIFSGKIYYLDKGVYLEGTSTGGTDFAGEYVQVSNAGADMLPDEMWLEFPDEKAGTKTAEPKKNVDLKACFNEQIGKKYAEFLQDDYDGDGKEEAYVITGTYSDADMLYDNVNIYFVSSNGDCSMLGEKLTGIKNKTVDTGNGKFMVWIRTAGGSGSLAYIYGVKNGQAHVPKVSGQYDTFWQENGSYFAEKGDFDKGYHDWTTYEFTYDAANKEFIKK